MHNDYIKDVSRFGGASPYVDEEGDRFNLRHGDDFDPSQMSTDGAGNIVTIPLVRRKPCLGRPERFVRGSIPTGTWTNDRGEVCLVETRCDECKIRSPGAYEACGIAASERIESAPPIKAAFDAWLNACEGRIGRICFVGARGQLWHAFLSAIKDHGGWTNVNEDAVKLDALQRRQDQKNRRNAARRSGRAKMRESRRGGSQPITQDYPAQLGAERDRRAEHLRRLRDSSTAPRWLTRLKDDGCERTADVWEVRSLLAAAGHKPTGTAIAEHLIKRGKGRGLEIGSLAARVYDDLKRIAKLEDDAAGAPIWKAFSTP